MTLQKWLHRAKVEEGTAPGQSQSEAAEIRELRKRNRLLEQENEVLGALWARWNLRPLMSCPFH